MGATNRDKWLFRAEQYQEILRTGGIKKAKEYLNRFGKKKTKIINAIWEVEELREQAEENYQEEAKAMKNMVVNDKNEFMDVNEAKANESP